MVVVFHGFDKDRHDAFQAWRRSYPNGFHMTEVASGKFNIHWTQDKRENPIGRGCIHQGVSTNQYKEDANSCYTVARKVCSESLSELHAWIAGHGFEARSCAHCDTKKFPFPAFQDGCKQPAATLEALEGQIQELIAFRRTRTEALRVAALERARGVCECCRIDFSRLIDGAGRAALQVHHTAPLGSRGPDGALTRLEDLAVLCANCHAFIHAFGKEPIPVAELRHRLAS